MNGSGVEAKVAAGSVTGIVTGLLTWALVTYVPAFRTGLPPQLAAFLPVAIGWALSTYAAWRVPHTPRPGVVTNVPAYSIPQRVPPSTGPLPDPPAPGAASKTP
jgi:hypothetical protein